MTSIPVFIILRQQTQVFDAVAAYGLTGIDPTGAGVPEHLSADHYGKAIHGEGR
jgi:hypothetical protein